MYVCLFILQGFESAITSPNVDILLTCLFQIHLKLVETIGMSNFKF